MARRILLTVFATWVLAANVDGQQKPSPETPRTTTGDASRGKTLYDDYSCWACHGSTAQTGNGQRLQPARLDERQFVAYLRSPRTRQMPAYTAKVMSDREAADIYAFVLSLPRAPEVKDVPVLNDLLREVR